MSSDYSGLIDDLPRGRGAWIAGTLAALACACVTAGVLAVLSFFTSFAGKSLICPDGGDEVWHRPGPAVIWPELLTGLALTLAAWLVIGAVLRARAVDGAFAAGGWLALASSGAVTAYVVLSDSLYIAAQPARYRCAEQVAGGGLPAWAAVLLALAFPVTLGLVALRAGTRRGA